MLLFSPVQDATAVQKWIMQFEPEHRAYAIRLLESLTLVPTAYVRQFIENSLKEIVESSPTPVACFIVRDTRKEPYFPLYDKINREFRRKRPVAVVRRASSRRSGRRNTHDGVGSEALFANWLTQWARVDDEHILDQPTFDDMAKHSCRDIVFLDDIVGSGTRARRYLGEVKLHRTFRSWQSGQSIRFHYLAYCASEDTARELAASLRGLRVVTATVPTLGRNLWDEAELSGVQAACVDAAKRSGSHQMLRSALGFKKSLATMVFEHSCPNNTPAVLWFDEPGRWRPLFPNRGVPSDLGLTTVAQRWSLALPDRILHLKWRTTAGHVDLTSSDGPKALRLLVGLSKGRRLRETDRLSEYAGVDLPTLARLQKTLVLVGWLDQDLRVTERGRAEVRYLKKQVGHPDWTPELEEDRFYFPRW